MSTVTDPVQVAEPSPVAEPAASARRPPHPPAPVEIPEDRPYLIPADARLWSGCSELKPTSCGLSSTPRYAWGIGRLSSLPSIRGETC